MSSSGTPIGYSTPQHSQIARLRQQRSSFTPPRSSRVPNGDGHSYRTPPTASRSSSGNSSNDVFSASPAGTPGKTPRKIKIIRTSKPWTEKLFSIPRDLWDRYELSWSEALNLDSDLIGDFGYPAGFALLSLHIFLRLSLTATHALQASSHGMRKAQHGANTAEQRLDALRRASVGGWGLVVKGRGLLLVIARSLSWMLLLISVTNALWLFTRKRKYRLFLRNEPINSPNAKMVSVDNAAEQNASEEGKIPMWKRLQRSLQDSLSGIIRPRSQERKQVQELSVWTPPIFSLRLFAIYSPPLALFTQVLDRSNLSGFAIAALFLLVQTSGLVHVYSQNLEDRLIISREVMHEYDTKFVNPRINYSRRDASTMTNEAEMVDVSDWSPHSRNAKYTSVGNGRQARSSTSRNWQ